MRKFSKFMMGVLAVTLTLNSSTMIFANEDLSLDEHKIIEEVIDNEEVLNDDIVEDIKEIVDEEINNEEIVVKDNEEVKTYISELSSELVSSEEELIEAINSSVGDVVITFDVSEISLSSVLEIDSNKINSLTFKSTVSENVKLINDGGDKHIEIKGSGDITLNMYEVVLSGNTKSNGGIKAYDVNNISINGLVIKDNIIKVKNWITSFVTVKAKGNVTFKDLFTDNNTVTEDSEQDTGLIRVEVINGLVAFEDSNINNTTIKTLIGNNISINGDNNKVVLKNVAVNDSIVKQGSAGFSIFSKQDVQVTVDNAVLKNNTTNVGNSGSLNFKTYQKITLDINDSVFDGNFSYRGGAGVYVDGSKGMSVSINNSVFNNNEAIRINYDKDTGVTTGLPSNGGAIYLSTTGGSDSSFDLLNSSFNNNYAGTGGAIAIFSQGAYVKTLVENTDFINNTADYSSGALSYYFGNSSEVIGALTIKDSNFISNVVTGKDNGPSYYRGGDGGAISINELRKFPNLLKISDTVFRDNEAAIKNYWHYDKNSDGVLDRAYTENILNTTYSADTSLHNVKNRSNVFNGDDIHFDKTAYVVLDFSEDDYEDLVVNNYNTESLVYFNAYTGTHFSELIEPTADGYTFIGWKDSDGKMWKFDEHVLAEDMDKGQYHIKAIWAKTVATSSVLTVKYLDTELNEIMDNTKIIGEVSDTYSINVIDIDGYKFKSELDNKSLSGTFSGEDIEINLIYEKVIKDEITPDPEDENKDINDNKDVETNTDSDKKNPNTGLTDLSLIYKLVLLVSSVFLGIILFGVRKIKRI